jgi:iron(III) transport system ATP-binding protein
MSAIELVGVSKCFGSTPVLAGVDLLVADGSTTAVLGASGSGKTTLLRVIAGFEQIDEGTVRIGGVVVDDGHASVRAQRRAVGYVPQEGALFPHLSALRNIGFGLGRRDRARAFELLELVGLDGLGGRYPHQLSGGQQQRVALARALAIQPKVVLMDEPFSSLDASLRAEVRHDIAVVLAETNTTTVLVTHDQDEALSFADQIAVLRDGRVVAAADPRSLYREPPDLAAAASIGEAIVLPVEITGGQARSALGPVALAPEGAGLPDGPGQLLLRPEQLVAHLGPVPGGVPATVVELQYHGHDTLGFVTLEGSGTSVAVRLPADFEVDLGQAVWIEVTGNGRAWTAT